MQVHENVLLAPYTTFKIGGPAIFFVYAQTDEEIIATVEHASDLNVPLLVFGGGSNVLVSDLGFKGLAMRIETIGMDIEETTDEYVILKVASGEVWDDVVRFTVEQEWYGIENLSHIPGFMGGFAVQNVGAYGQEASQTVTKVEAYDTKEQKVVILSADNCQFGYRSSIFNTTNKGRYIILHTYLKLQKNGAVNLSYSDLRKYFSEGIPSIAQVRNAVITIRDTKFPFPDTPTTGNAGSFFNAPIIADEAFTKLTQQVKESFGIDSQARLASMQDRLKVLQGYKVPYAFLIEQCGLKGYQSGGAKVNEPHPGVIVNVTGGATAKDVLKVAKHVIETVRVKTGIILSIEPRLIGFNESEISELFGNITEK
ncbi:MAG: UDP-N-acetylmuramate dehydrogenase [bacterium]|nr:UDP-N-acetylmuramate dehydrogenase [bacterium]